MFSKACLSVSFFLLLGNLLFADIPGPGPRPRPPRPIPLPAPVEETTKQTAPVEVRHADLSKDGKGVAAKIAIPKKVLAKLVPGEGVAQPLGSSPKSSSLPWWATVIAGLAMACGAVGLLFVARESKVARLVAGTAMILAMITGSYALADLRVPGEEPKPVETVLFEVVEGDAVIITLPK